MCISCMKGNGERPERDRSYANITHQSTRGLCGPCAHAVSLMSSLVCFFLLSLSLCVISYEACFLP